MNTTDGSTSLRLAAPSFTGQRDAFRSTFLAMQLALGDVLASGTDHGIPAEQLVAMSRRLDVLARQSVQDGAFVRSHGVLEAEAKRDVAPAPVATIAEPSHFARETRLFSNTRRA